MSWVIIDSEKEQGRIKRMNAVNNGPLPKTPEQPWENFEDYKALEIPYARLHDASFCSRYGGEHCVDIAFVFPDFEADVNDPNSYDFQLTDEYLETMIAAGTEPFYRLGTKIEHWSKKYNTLPPSDFAKWAQICEHVILHYTQGWANGFNFKIDYWEIWNEADGLPDDAPAQSKVCWGGTKAQFFEFYGVVAKHLKSRFPHLKIGGPAVCSVGRMVGPFPKINTWVADFLEYCSLNSVPLDFFSWHTYTHRVDVITTNAICASKALKKYGFDSTESILDEWNYTIGFIGDDFTKSVQGIIGIKGAVFAAAVMSDCQSIPVDMLMYYDLQPGLYNGLFDFYTQKPLKTYYTFKIFSELFKLGTQISAVSTDKEIYTLAAKDGDSSAFMWRIIRLRI